MVVEGDKEMAEEKAHLVGLNLNVCHLNENIQ